MVSVLKKIEEESLLRKGGKYLVALSGGADSVFLVHALHRLGYTFEAVHCNFHLRGEESDRDETFCKEFCKGMDIPLHIAHFDTKTYAQLHKVSIEMAARTLRYGYFGQLLDDLNADGVCVAHHREDSVETVLINLLRGTGLRGLTGISACNGKILRPMLNITREEIEQYLAAVGQKFVTDSTNLETIATRNKIRLEVLPLLKTINPSVIEDIGKTAWRLSEANKIVEHSLKQSAARVVQGDCIVVERLFAEPSPEYLLYHLLSPYGFNSPQIENIFLVLQGATADTTGCLWNSSTHELLYDRGLLKVQPIAMEALPQMRLPETGVYAVGDVMRLSVSQCAVDEQFCIPTSQDSVAVDASKVVFPLTVRPAAPGDRFVPFGMKGSKLVSDYLTDKKMDLFERRRQYVLADASGRIVWLVGERVSNEFRISKSTRQALLLSL